MNLKAFGRQRRPTRGESGARVGAAGLVRSEWRLKRILVAVDFSEGSRRAAEFAASLAGKVGAEATLVHVFEGVPGELKIVEATFVDTSFRDEAQQNLAVWQRELGAAVGGVKSVFREGASVHREIVRAAEESKADLIVLGRAGGWGINTFLTGNVVAKVLSHAPCPVLVV